MFPYASRNSLLMYKKILSDFPSNFYLRFILLRTLLCLRIYVYLPGSGSKDLELHVRLIFRIPEGFFGARESKRSKKFQTDPPYLSLKYFIIAKRKSFIERIVKQPKQNFQSKAKKKGHNPS